MIHISKIKNIITKNYFILLAIFILSAVIRVIIFNHTENYFLNWEEIPTANIVSAKLCSFKQILNVYLLPLHLLLIKLSLTVHNDPLFSPRFISLFFGCLLTIPFFFLVKSAFNKENSIFSSILLCLYPIQVIQSVISTEMALFHFLLISALFFIQRYFYSNNILHLSLSIILMNLAHMVRIESWLIVLLIVSYFLLNKKFKEGILFLCLGNLFIIFSFIYHKPVDYIFQQSTQSRLDINLLLEAKRLAPLNLFSIVFWLKMLIKTLNAPLVIISLLGIVLSLIARKNIFFLAIFCTNLSAYTYKFLTKTVPPHPRYSVIMGIFLIPFAFYFLQTCFKDKKWTRILSLLLLFFSLGYSATKNMVIFKEKMPSLLELSQHTMEITSNHNLAKEIVNRISTNVGKREKIFIDHSKNGIIFLSIIAYSQLNPHNILYLSRSPFVQNSRDLNALRQEIHYLFTNKKPTYLILFRNGGFYHLFEEFKTNNVIGWNIRFKEILSERFYDVYKRTTISET